MIIILLIIFTLITKTQAIIIIMKIITILIKMIIAIMLVKTKIIILSMKLIIIIAATVDVEETSYLYQRIFVALQRFSAI